MFQLFREDSEANFIRPKYLDKILLVIGIEPQLKIESNILYSVASTYDLRIIVDSMHQYYYGFLPP